MRKMQRAAAFIGCHVMVGGTPLLGGTPQRGHRPLDIIAEIAKIRFAKFLNFDWDPMGEWRRGSSTSKPMA